MKTPVTFELVLHADPDEMAEILTLWGALLQKTTLLPPVTNGVHKKTRVTGHPVSRHQLLALTKKPIPSSYTGVAWVIAHQVCVKALAGKLSINRSVLLPLVSKALVEKNLSPTSASPTLSAMVKAGLLIESK